MTETSIIARRETDKMWSHRSLGSRSPMLMSRPNTIYYMLIARYSLGTLLKKKILTDLDDLYLLHHTSQVLEDVSLI